MSEPNDVTEKASLRRKNRIVLIALAVGILVPILHIVFLAHYLPEWLNVVIIGIVFYACFSVVIPFNTTGIFRRKKG